MGGLGTISPKIGGKNSNSLIKPDYYVFVKKHRLS
jgi:hypothetical protein